MNAAAASRPAARPRQLAAAFLASALFLLDGCGGQSGRVSLGQLTEHQDAYTGKQVKTIGVVRKQRDPSGETYYVLSDSAGDLVGLKPAATARPRVGERVEVRGRFAVEAGFGRLIWISSIRAS